MVLKSVYIQIPIEVFILKNLNSKDQQDLKLTLIIVKLN